MASETLYEQTIVKFVEAIRADDETSPGFADAIEALVSKPETPADEELVDLLMKDPDKEAKDGLD